MFSLLNKFVGDKQMIVYHIDRNNTLKEGLEIQLKLLNNSNNFFVQTLFPDGLSMHGLHYVDETLQHNQGNLAEYYSLEYEYELVRRIYFSKLPSRFQSFFALRNLDQIKQWNDVFSNQDIVWEVEIENSFFIERDSNLLRPTLTKEESNNNEILHFSPNNSFYYSYLYWNGARTETPRAELLIPLNQQSIKIKGIVGTVDSI
ncbi:DUF2441 domain-containing protein [Blautia wexlerae]|mgnify:CR=1 FL=1|jgi:hypothetical protein|nr:DUF2441 domain-containing protein [Blautia wexlerae]